MHYHAEVYLKDLEDVESQIDDILYPYNEQIETEEYSEGEVSKEELTRFVEHYANEYPEDSDLSLDELYEKYGDEWNGGSWRKTDGVWEEFSTYNKESFYDWYEIGGRWTGSHDNFNPEDDPENLENGELKWPTEWARHDGDIIAVKDISDDLDCYTLVVGDEVFHETDFDGNVKKKLSELGITEGYLVTVDYHC